MKKHYLLAAFLFLTGCGSMIIVEPQQTDTSPPFNPAEPLLADRDVAPVLVTLLDERKLERPVQADFQESALGDIIKLTTPAGYRLKNRFLELGVPLSQALSFSRDNQLRNRLLEAARWTHSPRVRSEALIALSRLRDPEHFKFFREALFDHSISVQFSAIEALQIWGGPEAGPLLMNTAGQTWSPLIRVYAAQAALRMGEEAAREQLIQFLKGRNWLMRAMSAKYLGDLGRGDDLDLLLSRIGPEDNRFALVEVCVAALKLAAKQGGFAAPKPPPPPPRPPSAPRPRRQPFELEPLVVTAPRVQLAIETVDVRIDNELVRLLERIADEPPPAEQIVDPELVDLNNLITPAGFSLKIRYSDIRFLLAEGLAGTRNFGLVQRLENLARNNPNPSVRATALIALGYDRQRLDLSIFRDALKDSSVIVRFGAIEALGVLGNSHVIGTLADTANSDSSKVVRVFAAQALRRVGDPYGREHLLRFMDDPDHVIRAMAVRYLGELGESDDYNRIIFRLNSETNHFVTAEICLALLRLSP